MRLALLPIAVAFSLLACSGGDDSTSPTGAHLVFKVQPASVAAGQVLTPAVQVDLENAAGTLITNGAPTITLGVEPSGSGATLSGHLTQTATAGVAVFSDLSITKSGAYTLVAVTPDASGATSTGFSVLPLRATAIAAAAGDGQQTGIRGAVSQPPSVLATDVFGNPVPGVGVVFVVVTGGGAVEGDHQITSGDGIAAVGNWTLGSTPGANTLHATSEGLTGSPVVFNATATPIATAVTIQVRDNIFVSERNGSGGRSSFFSGAVDTIAAGGTVTWVWVGQNHNVTPSQSNDPSLSGNQNAPFTLGPITFSSAGVYEYRCTNHSHAVDGEIVGMKGRIVIR